MQRVVDAIDRHAPLSWLAFHIWDIALCVWVLVLSVLLATDAVFVPYLSS